MESVNNVMEYEKPKNESGAVSYSSFEVMELRN